LCRRRTKIRRILAREDPRDAFVSQTHENPAALPAGAVVGTSSLRRQAQIAARHPALEIRALRGNVETRVAKLDRGEYAAIVLAAAGLKRLGLATRIRSTLSIEDCLPAAGQGALGVECLAERADLLDLLKPLDDPDSSACVRAERQVNLALGGSCTIPLGAYAQIDGGKMQLRALVAAPDGKRVARAEGAGEPRDAEALGMRVAALLRERGAGEILAALAP
jgi:hydroxymethylbilane synthase